MTDHAFDSESTTIAPIRLIPARGAFDHGDDVLVDVRGPGSSDPESRLLLVRLGEPVAEFESIEPGAFRLRGQGLPPGGYGLEWRSGGTLAHGACEISDPSRPRVRYGFVSDYAPGRPVAGLGDAIRDLHLTDVQFYDWAYRHADLLGGGELYDDALGQPISLETVRGLAEAARLAGARALGYAAVYAVGDQEWSRWSDLALVRGTGEPYGLADFLSLVDPAAPRWLAHFVADLVAAARTVGLDGFHLDQYGYPKIARRRDGEIVDVGASFAALIARVREALPSATLIFNNVNDFPTWTTGASPQDVVYIEAWEPQSTLTELAKTVARARVAGAGKPVVIAAYQSVYESANAAAADRAARLTMATLFSSGATHLFAGDSGRVLVDPYYVRNHIAEPSTWAMLRRWYDFLVEHGDVLVDPGIVDVTTAFAGAYNDDIEIAYARAEVASSPVPGTLWRRITATSHGYAMHVINLAGQADEAWDTPKAPFSDVGEGRIRIRKVNGCIPRVRYADPDLNPRLRDVDVRDGGDYADAILPAPGAWQLILIDLTNEGNDA